MSTHKPVTTEDIVNDLREMQAPKPQPKREPKPAPEPAEDDDPYIKWYTQHTMTPMTPGTTGSNSWVGLGGTGTTSTTTNMSTSASNIAGYGGYTTVKYPTPILSVLRSPCVSTPTPKPAPQKAHFDLQKLLGRLSGRLSWW